jgi:hypothetical protein
MVRIRRIVAALLIAAPVVLPAQGAAATAPRLDFSGIMFGAFQYQTAAGARNTNKFDMERAYLNFRMPVADRLSMRVTADLSPQQSGTGYVFRAKYAFLQYDRPASARGYSGLVRAGVLQTVTIEHQEQFWPRWMGTVGLERFGYFSSADVGVAGQVNFPKKRGELYAVMTNGSGYSRPETDRFKSYAARLTLTPLAAGKHGLLTTFAISPWIDINQAASKFVAGGAGQAGAIGEGLLRNRYGIFAGIRDPRLVVGAGYSQRVDGTEGGANTAAAPRTVSDIKGSLMSAFTVIRPFQLADNTSKSPVSIMVRYDAIQPDKSLSSQRDHLFESSLIFDVANSRRAQVAFDFQETLGTAPASAITPNKMFQVRMVANF